MRRLNVFLAIAAAFGLVLSACDSGGAMEDSGPETMWKESFENGVGNWTTDETSGPKGWCGDIAQVGSGGTVSPSNGSGYATAAHGQCNDFYTENGFPNGSGPFGPFGEYNDEVGFDSNGNGFLQELDVYLDPSVSAPDTTVFTYAATFDLLDKEFPDNFRYALVPVTKPGETLLVGGEAINEAGWYTFRHRMTSEGGSLAVDFELVRDGEVLFTQSVTTTAFKGDEVSSFKVSNVGTGYAWFVVIKPGYQLPIDRQKVRRLR